MPFEQYKVEVPSTNRGNGSSDTESLQTAYPGSPIHRNELNDETVTDQGNELLVGGDLGSDVEAVAYWDLPTSYNRDYADSPNLNEVEVGGGGLPGSPYAPNIATPPEGQNPADIPEAGVEVTQDARGAGGAFDGDGLASPHETKENVSRQTIGSLTLGSSNPSS